MLLLPLRPKQLVLASEVKETRVWLNLLSLENTSLHPNRHSPWRTGALNHEVSGTGFGPLSGDRHHHPPELLQALPRPTEDLFIILTGRKH